MFQTPIKHCRNCGAAVIYRLPDDGDTRERAVCPACQTIHYQNPLNVVGTVPYWGEQVTAFVVLRPGMNASAESLLAACGEKLSRYKIPKEVRFVAALPRNSMGKVLRRMLRDMRQ